MYVGNGTIGDYLAGHYALATGDPTVASTDLMKAAAANPHNPEIALEALIACLDADRPEALILARQLPDSQIAQLVLANADVKAGNWQQAEDRFHGLPRQGRIQFLQPLLVAWAQEGAGHAEAALATLQPYIDNPQFHGVFALHAATIADLAGDMSDATRLYGVAQGDLSNPNLRLVQLMASWQARSGHPAEAQRILLSLLPVAPDLSIAMPAMLTSVLQRPIPHPIDGVAEAYFTFAALLRAQDQSEFASIMLRLALDLRPDFTPARLLNADILALGGHPEQALHMLDAVPATDPLLPVVRLRRASLDERAGHTTEALQALEKMAQDYPSSPLPDEQRGDILRAQNKFPEAVAAYDRAVSRITDPVPSDWVAFYDRGVAEERSHEWPKAVADFKHALTLSPDQPFVLNYLGYSWADQGRNLLEARQMIERAALARPNDGAITDSLGWVEFRQGDYKAAVKTLQRAAELDPADATINGHLGDAYSAVGRRLEAEYQWRRALTLNPDPDDAARLEAKLNATHVGAVVSNP